jgi:hypothetical protein
MIRLSISQFDLQGTFFSVQPARLGPCRFRIDELYETQIFSSYLAFIEPGVR